MVRNASALHVQHSGAVHLSYPDLYGGDVWPAIKHKIFDARAKEERRAGARAAATARRTKRQGGDKRDPAARHDGSPASPRRREAWGRGEAIGGDESSHFRAPEMRLVEDTPENHSQAGCVAERTRLVTAPTIPRLAWPAILAWI
jgi:hypothetical protein